MKSKSACLDCGQTGHEVLWQRLEMEVEPTRRLARPVKSPVPSPVVDTAAHRPGLNLVADHRIEQTDEPPRGRALTHRGRQAPFIEWASCNDPAQVGDVRPGTGSCEKRIGIGVKNQRGTRKTQREEKKKDC